MKLTLHIGTPKTASTYLQNICAANPEWLAGHGILYPDLKSPTPNHITLYYASAKNIHDFARDFGLQSQEDVLAFRDELSEHIRRQIETAPRGIDTMLMSSENLTGNLIGAPGVQSLHEMLAPLFDEIRVIVYLRRQDDAILSMYGEFMRRGFSDDTFDAFMTRALGKATPTPYLYYKRVLDMWIDAFGREAISVRLFGSDWLRDGDILTDFMTELTQADAPPDFTGLNRTAFDNVGLSAPALEFLRRMYSFIPNRKDKVLNPVRGRLNPAINALPSEPRPRMSRAQSQRIMEHFAGANGWL